MGLTDWRLPMTHRTQQVSSFQDIQNTLDSFKRADTALAGGVARGVLRSVQVALGAGANPLQAQDDSGRHLFVQAMAQDEGEEMVCALLGQMPAVVQVDRMADREAIVALEDGRQMGIVVDARDQPILDRLVGFLRDLIVWKANFPLRENQAPDLAQVRRVNRRFLDGVAAGQMAVVEMTMAEGACVLTATPEGVPALALACEHPNHALLMGAILANDPSVGLVEIEGQWSLRNLPYARMVKGGAPYIPADPVEAGLAIGHAIPVDPAALPDVLLAHLRTLSQLGEAINSLTVEYLYRGAPTQLRWPNQVDFQRLLADRFAENLAAVQAGRDGGGAITAEGGAG